MKEAITVSCIGDSLTAGEMRYSGRPVPMSYQYWMDNYLKDNDIYVNISNYGMPGALMNSITRQVSLAIPTDWIVIMGGTNDFWSFSNPLEPEMNEEAVDDVLNEISIAINKAIKGNIKNIIICSIPPVGINGGSLGQMHKNILKANLKIKKLAFKLGVLFCDVHLEMSDPSNNFQMESGLCEYDGVHFTRKGNERCGIAIGKIISENWE